jgi:hypothetical protein
VQVPQWHADGDIDGLHVELKDVPGSHFQEVRITTRSDRSLQSLCDAIYSKDFDSKLEGRFKKRELLKQTATERWTYEQISVPVTADRDYVMHVRLLRAAPSGECEVAFETQDDEGRPPPDGFVRIKKIRGRWTLIPNADGKVAITYEVFSDPGGNLPAFLVRGPQKSAAIEFMKTILARAEAKR